MPHPPIFDFIIIGSGPSGGRISYDLTQAGASCLLLEAGRTFTPDTLPLRELDYTSQMYWNGGLEPDQSARFFFLRGKALGGTSLVNQALLDRFDDFAFKLWNQAGAPQDWNLTSFTHLYETIEASLTLKTLGPEERNRNAKLFIQAMELQKYRWAPLRRGQKNCGTKEDSDCIACLGGCPRESKQSTAVTWIPEAQKNGLQIKTEFEACKIESKQDQVSVWGIQHGEKKQVFGKNLILAAGALGTTSLLLRSDLKKKIPALGSRFSCHLQFMNLAYFEDPVDAHKGAFQTVKSEEPTFRRMGFKLENVFAPPASIAFLLPGYGSAHLQWMKRYRFFACIEFAIRDQALGSISLSPKNKLLIQKPLSEKDQNKIERGKNTVKELFESIDAKQVLFCPQGFGLHLMGGCPIGTSETQAVITPEFHLFYQPNIYVVDSSIFPAAPGINPSLTIMAIAHLASQKILKKGGTCIS